MFNKKFEKQKTNSHHRWGRQSIKKANSKTGPGNKTKIPLNEIRSHPKYIQHDWKHVAICRDARQGTKTKPRLIHRRERKGDWTQVGTLKQAIQTGSKERHRDRKQNRKHVYTVHWIQFISIMNKHSLLCGATCGSVHLKTGHKCGVQNNPPHIWDWPVICSHYSQSCL